MRSVRTFSALAMSLMALTMADVAPLAQRSSLADRVGHHDPIR
jgi:hypothetical protein